jgi:diacylglycerol kinase
MWLWLITKLVSFWSNEAVATAVKAVVTDLTTHSMDLAQSALDFAKTAEGDGLKNKAAYVYKNLEKQFPDAGKSVLNTAIEAAASAIQQGLTK